MHIPPQFRLGAAAALLIGAVAFRVSIRTPGADQTQVVPGATEASSDLLLKPENLDFGRVPLQPDFRWTLGVENTSVHPVMIEKFQTSCTCTRVSPKSVMLGPGERRDVELTLDLTRADLESHRIPVGDTDYEVTVSPVLEGAQRPAAIWAVRGKVVKSLDLSVHDLLFGEVLRAVTAEPRRVEVVARTGISRLAASSESQEIVAEVKPPDRERPEHRELSVSVKSSENLGTREAMIRLDGETVDGTPLQGFVKARWTAVEDVMAIPGELVDLARRRGDVFRARVAVAPRLETTIRVATFESDSPSVKIRPVDRPGGQAPEFDVETTIDAEGEVRHSVRFTVLLGDQGAVREQITLPILGFGLGDQNTTQGR